MNTIRPLTEAQREQFPKFIQKWREIRFDITPTDWRRAENAIRTIYKQAKLREPRIIWCSSPSDIISNHNRDTNVWDKIRNLLWSEIANSTGNDIWIKILSATADSVYSSTGGEIWGSIRNMSTRVTGSSEDNIRDIIWQYIQITNPFSTQLENAKYNSMWNNVYGDRDGNWLGFYDFCSEVLSLTEQTKRFVGLWELARSAGWMMAYKNVCFISERHTVLKLDDQKRVHCQDGPAISYPDGWSVYAWHGVHVPSDWITNKSVLTPELALSQINIEQRRVACEIVGWASILTKLNARTINKDPDPEIGELLEVDLPRAVEKERFLKVVCGTGRTFALPVPLTVNTALEASAWTYGISDLNSYKPEVRT